MGVCNCSMFCCTLLYVHSSIAIILMGKRELVALLNLSSWCLVMVERLFLVVPQGCLQFVIVVFPDHTHLLFWYCCSGFYLLEIANSFINCIITIPVCCLPNGITLSNFMNYSKCSAHISKGKKLYFPLKFCVSQYMYMYSQ